VTRVARNRPADRTTQVARASLWIRTMANGRDRPSLRGRNGRSPDDDDEEAGAPSAGDTVWDAQAWAAATPAADRQHLRVEPELWRAEEAAAAAAVDAESPVATRAPAPQRRVPWTWITLGLATAWFLRRARRRARA
jgi:hypothetical protein